VYGQPVDFAPLVTNKKRLCLLLHCKVCANPSVMPSLQLAAGGLQASRTVFIWICTAAASFFVKV
jgi:hypothetical protein